MTEDIRGLPTTATGPDAVSALDHAIDGYLGMASDTGERLKSVYAEDPAMPMADILRGYFFMLMAVPALKNKARGTLSGLEQRDAEMTPRERLHGAALDSWAHGRTDEALRRWEEILLDYPTDILALRLAHHGYFYRGDSQNLRDTVGRVLHAWNAEIPGYGYVKGMQAFGLEETHAYDAAVRAGQEAVDHIPKNPWAIHAVAHVHEMTGRPEEGIAWLTDTEADWSDANNFRYHVWWHRALMHLDLGEYDAVLGLYDEALWDPASDEYLDLCNDAALLMRLELHDVDVGSRWEDLAEKCRSRKSEGILTFIDAHFALALAAVDGAAADEAVELQRRYAETDIDDDNRRVSAEIGVRLAEGIVAYKASSFGKAVSCLAPIRYEIPRIGGSHAQRDLFAMILLDAAIRDGQTGLARALAAERLQRLPNNAWSRRSYDRARAMQ